MAHGSRTKGASQAPFASRGGWIVPVATFLFLALLGYGFLLDPDRVPATAFSDFVPYHLGSRTVLWDAIREGRLPFWRSDQLAGYGGLTNPQAGYAWPGNFLFWVMPPSRALGPTCFLHFLAGGASFWLLGAALELGRPARRFLAVAGLFQFKLILAVHAGWLAMLPSIVLLPASLASVVLVFRKPGAPAGLAVAVAGGACLHAGQLQLCYYLGLL